MSGPLSPLEQLLAYADHEEAANGPAPNGKQHIARWAYEQIVRLQAAPEAPAVATGQTREARMVTITPPGTPPNAMIWCDPEIVDLVKALNDAGLATVASCSGHGHRPGSIVLRDGRALMVFDSLEHAKPAHDAYPLDINGDVGAWATKAGVTP